MVDEREGSAFAFGTGGAPNAVYIIFGITGGFKVHHQVNPININATT